MPTLLAVLTLLLMQVPQVVCQHGDTQARYSVLGSVCLIGDAHDHMHTHHHHHGAAHDHDHDHEAHAHALVQAELVHAGSPAILPPADVTPALHGGPLVAASAIGVRAGEDEGWTRAARGAPPAFPDDPVRRATTLLL